MSESAFDWVEARANCTIAVVFEQLAKDAQGDLERHKALNPGPTQSLRFDTCNEDIFYVERYRNHRVVFTKERERICIIRWAYSGDPTPLMVLRVHMGDDGKCRLIDEDQNEWKPWQVRRKALEETLFGST